MHVHSNNIIKRARSDKKPIWGDVSFRESAKCTQFHNFHSYLSTFVYGYMYLLCDTSNVEWEGQSSLLQIYSNCSDQRASVRIVLHIDKTSEFIFMFIGPSSIELVYLYMYVSTEMVSIYIPKCCVCGKFSRI